ncbi:Stk1 family PASTA domain-containing Ser/Thr kinase [Clostridiaceae bacterium]|nr:Stk1 family PASTA domain-containing Ser/Thr kinase [Clostridiaceae bacterium]RKI11125.1 Stk1 family PASTA domain-containing Ser/Thr kinase [bacterium 1XD21-70]
MLRPGVYLQNRYEVLEQVGSGGMSEVYKAKCHKLNRLVAVKVLKEEFSNDGGFVSKFKMEAQAAARLSHPNIVNVYDVIDEGKLHYIVMELIEGVTLKGYIARKEKLEAKESIGIAIQVAQGIAAAHEQGIIHRDIKPQNVIISMDGKVKVTDFGIARGVSTQTLTSAAMGSVHYISPEQARGGYSDNRSDIYSLGITMYEMLTGRVPYEGENTVAIALAHLEEAMVPPSEYNPGIPVSLERIILKCTAKKPENRYGSANELIADLRKALVQPEGDFVQDPDGQMALNGHTVKISGKDLARIKEQYTPLREEPVREYVRKPTGETAATRYPQSNRRQAKEPERRPVREQPDEINSHIEKILAAAGVVVAIIIVAVLIVVFSKLGGIFQSGSGLFGKQSTAPSADAVVQTGENGEILKDTEVYMPDVLELPEDLAEAKLKENFLGMKPTYQASDVVEKGYVISQDPEYGTVVAKYSNVNVVVSLGSDKIDLTALDLEAMSVASVRRLLEDKGLTVQVTEEENETVEKGMLIRYEPQKASEGGTVTLYVSTGPHVDLVPVPDLVGKTETDALALLGESGLLPGNTSTETSDTVPKGSIIRQEGGENGQIQVGGQISYVVSSGPEERQQRYVASISDVYDLSNLIGPGAIGANVTVLVRLHQQDADGTSIYRTLSEARTINGSSLLPINYTSIESMNGSDKGEVEVVDVESGAVLKSYPLTFFPMD